jgi:YkoY family integral membrane protein
MLAEFFGQTFEAHDLIVVLLLIVLEGTLSVDNALVLGLLARRLPEEQRTKALTYGLVGAFVFRFIALALATFLLKWTLFKLLGGAYLLYVAVKHFFFEEKEDHHHPHLPESGVVKSAKGKFWPTVLVIELTDLAFAVDSIVAAIGVVGPPPADHAADALHPKLWVVLTGGFIGVVLMRYAATLFIKLLDRFPRFETAAYLLVTLIALKLIIDYAAHAAGWQEINFHSVRSPAFWAFWVSMIVCFCVGFIGGKPKENVAV